MIVARLEVGVGLQVQNVAGVMDRGRGDPHWGTYYIRMWP